MQLYAIAITILSLIYLAISILLIVKAKKSCLYNSNQCAITTQEKELVLSFFHRMGEAFTEALDLNELLKLIIDFSRQTTKANAGAIFLREGEYLRAHIVDGIFPPLDGNTSTGIEKIASKVKYLNENLKKEKIPIGKGIIGKVVSKKRSILIKNAQDHPSIPKTNIDFIQIKTLMAVPLKFKDEIIGVMVAVNKMDDEPFIETDLSLFESLADQAAVSINNARLYQNISEKERIDRELKIAKEIQSLLLPKTFPEIKKFDIAAFSDPALEVGGDYFDFIPLENNKLGIVIADVSGKGIPASLMMVMCRSILRTIAPRNESPSQILSTLNTFIHPDMKYDMFISCLLGILDPIKGTFISARAGHEPILFYNKKENNISLVKEKGIAIGIDKDQLFNDNIADNEITLQRGDLLVLYTDGITEAIDANGNEFGIENLVNTISLASKLTSAEIAENIKKRIKRFTGSTPQHDDLTGLIIKAL